MSLKGLARVLRVEHGDTILPRSLRFLHEPFPVGVLRFYSFGWFGMYILSRAYCHEKNTMEPWNQIRPSGTHEGLRIRQHLGHVRLISFQGEWYISHQGTGQKSR